MIHTEGAETPLQCALRVGNVAGLSFLVCARGGDVTGIPPSILSSLPALPNKEDLENHKRFCISIILSTVMYI